ncbi:hypothetical protein HDU76_009076, partial [Blyttiomyces sp. JEL0837]
MDVDVEKSDEENYLQEDTKSAYTSVGSLPNEIPSKTTLASFGRKLLHGSYERTLSEIETRHPLSYWTLKFKDRELEEKYDMRVKYNSIPGNIASMGCVFIYTVIVIVYAYIAIY